MEQLKYAPRDVVRRSRKIALGFGAIVVSTVVACSSGGVEKSTWVDDSTQLGTEAGGVTLLDPCRFFPHGESALHIAAPQDLWKDYPEIAALGSVPWEGEWEKAGPSLVRFEVAQGPQGVQIVGRLSFGREKPQIQMYEIQPNKIIQNINPAQQKADLAGSSFRFGLTVTRDGIRVAGQQVDAMGNVVDTVFLKACDPVYP